MDVLFFIIWAIPAAISLCLTFRESYFAEEKVLIWWIAGFVLCLLWPMTLLVVCAALSYQRWKSNGGRSRERSFDCAQGSNRGDEVGLP